jgi:hypothetical protein
MNRQVHRQVKSNYLIPQVGGASGSQTMEEIFSRHMQFRVEERNDDSLEEAQ